MRIAMLSKWILSLIVILILFPSGTAYPQANRAEGNVENSVYLPLVILPPSPDIKLTKEVSVDGGTTWDDANNPPGPSLVEGGSAPLYRYTVTNEGIVDLSNVSVTDNTGLTLSGPSGDDGDAILQATETWVYDSTGAWRAGQQTNTATVDADFTDNGGNTEDVQDSDDANYFGANPAIQVVKEVSINGGTTWDDANNPTGHLLVEGGPDPIFRYTVTNEGNVNLLNITVSDSNGLTLSGPSGDDGDAILQSTETWVYDATGVWMAGQQTNTATADAGFTDDGGNTEDVQDSDDANYFGANPGIKVVNEVSVDGGTTWNDANSPTGPSLVEDGPAPYFRYIVTNGGNVDLSNVSISDNTGLTLSGPNGDNGDGILQSTETWLYNATGTWAAGQQTNTATADADFTDDGGNTEDVQDTDDANYFGADSDIELVNAWVGNADGYERSAFRPSDDIRYITVGENPYGDQVSVGLQWDQIGPCGFTQIFSDTVILESGLWVHALAEEAPDCIGTYTNTVKLTYENITSTLITTFDVVTYTTEIVVNRNQGFDKCGLPTVEQMQTWSQESPYTAFNIYLGGSSFACNNPQLDVDWVWDVSQQGWEYILTWVGPQSPCFDTIKPKISLNETIAYQQGKDEADLAVSMAENLGMVGEKIIYYDIEGYENNQGCREAVDSFLEGWTARLHEMGFKAGAYGSPCRSFVSDWWNNQPRLDDIWIARWILPAEYNPDVSVWGEVCGLTDEMWASNQRLRQYAGDHHESWGGESLGSIDSNVLLGEITAITTTIDVLDNLQTSNLQNTLQPQIHDMGLISTNNGWVVQGDQIMVTGDNGVTWDRITPTGTKQILGVDFLDPLRGWLVSLNSQGELLIYQTIDRGQSWQVITLPFSSVDVSAVYLDIVDIKTGSMVLKMVSSSNFSIGKLFVTQDGGLTWDQRSIPLGEPVHFSDPMNGWVAGGPTEDEFYRTVDGGKSWFESREQDDLTEIGAFKPTTIQGSLPDNTVKVSGIDPENVWTLTRNGNCSGEKFRTSSNDTPFRCWQETRLWTVQDGGQTWKEIVVK